jgi:uncharacterized zinc-type alcohol dehydrogenase-like protein
MSEIHALAAREARGKLGPLAYDPGPLADEQVEIDVQYCGICHSDLSMLNNDWGITQYPLVPGHEAIGTIAAMGRGAKSVHIGQTVGLGWNSRSCLHCRQCLTGNHNMCQSLEQTIVGRHGAFATKVRCHWCWATPIPEGIDLAKAGPLLCGGITVFNPLLECGVLPTHKVGVVGIGGLGHLALQFLNKWGCDVTAFTSSASKSDEARGWAPTTWWIRIRRNSCDSWRGPSISFCRRSTPPWIGRHIFPRWLPKAVFTLWVWCPSRCPFQRSR